MIVQWNHFAAEALDYEIIWIGAAQRNPIGSFSDFYAASSPIRRLVSGYLMLDESEASTITVSSHGKSVARVSVGLRKIAVTAEQPLTISGQRLEVPSGIAMIADPGTVWSTDRNSGSIVASSLGSWGVTIVHGPAPEKVSNRMRVLRAIHTVGVNRA